MRQVAFVSGYGGAGTTTCLLATAAALAAAGKRPLLIEDPELRYPTLASVPPPDGVDVRPGQVLPETDAGRYDLILWDFGSARGWEDPDAEPAERIDGAVYVVGRYRSRDLAHDRETVRRLGEAVGQAPVVCAMMCSGRRDRRAVTDQLGEFAPVVIPLDESLRDLICAPEYRHGHRLRRRSRRAVGQLAKAAMNQWQ